MQLDLKPSARGNVIQVQRKERELTDKDASADTKNENFTPPLKISSSPVKTAGTLNATRSSEIFTTQSTLKGAIFTLILCPLFQN